MTKQTDDSPLLRICGLWQHESRAGETYLTGKLNRSVRIVIFQNQNKTGENSPDWNLCLRQDEPKEGGS